MLQIFLAKIEEIIDFCLPKPFQNPTKMPPKMKSQKTLIFSRFLTIVLAFLLSSKPTKSWFSHNKIDIFQVFAKNAHLQKAFIFRSKNPPKTFPKRGPNPLKIDVTNVLFFNIDFFGSWPRFWSFLDLQEKAKLAQNGFLRFCLNPPGAFSS